MRYMKDSGRFIGISSKPAVAGAVVEGQMHVLLQLMLLALLHTPTPTPHTCLAHMRETGRCIRDPSQW